MLSDESQGIIGRLLAGLPSSKPNVRTKSNIQENMELYSGLLIIYPFASRSFNSTLGFLNQILFTLEFLKEVFWGLSFFSSS